MAQHDPPQPVHVPRTQKGEELVLRRGREPGRHGVVGHGPEEKGDQPYRTARDSTSINPEAHEPIDPRMPNIPPA